MTTPLERIRAVLDRLDECGWKATSIPAASMWRKTILRGAREAMAEMEAASRASPPARETADDPRRAWLRNSLRSCAEHERRQAARCRRAHRVEPYRSMSHEMADAHDEAAAVFERRLTAEDMAVLALAASPPAASPPGDASPDKVSPNVCACGHTHLAGSDGEDEGCCDGDCDCWTWTAPASPAAHHDAPGERTP